MDGNHGVQEHLNKRDHLLSRRFSTRPRTHLRRCEKRSESEHELQLGKKRVGLQEDPQDKQKPLLVLVDSVAVAAAVLPISGVLVATGEVDGALAVNLAVHPLTGVSESKT